MRCEQADSGAGVHIKVNGEYPTWDPVVPQLQVIMRRKALIDLIDKTATPLEPICKPCDSY